MLEVSSSKPLASESKGFAFWVEFIALGLPSAVLSNHQHVRVKESEKHKGLIALKHTGKCFSTSSISLTSEARGSSRDIATIFQSSSPSSIIAKAAKGLTFKTWPILARLSPISTTSTTEKLVIKKESSKTRQGANASGNTLHEQGVPNNMTLDVEHRLI
ncbi:hypothetical protein H5410_051945 [Solanum commersonii]|uniref:Uncharacterized protein n=1 Tax=Solanum commersonii TaxID=4109 RepID=A0A9J5X273_SOLCO|nr:hypothetical protein H5410_051945 [Solanum commersonii]